MAATFRPDEVKCLSKSGILRIKNTDHFNVHIVTHNGKLTGTQAKILAEVSETYGNGELSFSDQSTVVVHAVAYENLDTVLSLFSQADMITGGTGPRIHPIVACRGTACRFGLCDTLVLYEKLHERIYLGYREMELPHKFKIAVGGCPNNCVKPNLSDVGIMGRAVVRFDPALCRICESCSVQFGCPMGAAKTADGKLYFDKKLCNHCGRCDGKCPFGAVVRAAVGYAIYIGGRSGKTVSLGHPLRKIFTSGTEVLDVVERAILLYHEQGVAGERFADTIERLGFEYVQNQLLSGDASVQY